MLDLLVLLQITPAALFAAAAISSLLQPGSKFPMVHQIAYSAAFTSLLAALGSSYLAYHHELLESNFLTIYGMTLSLRVDALTTLMSLMISLLSIVIVKYSKNYLSGDSRQGVFTGRLCATIASVLILVNAGSLLSLVVGWILTSIFLQKLLIFYKNRPAAIVASRKKFIVARIGDIALISACIILYDHFGTGNLEKIFSRLASYSLEAGLPVPLEVAVILIVVAALLKSAQFPTQGWLLEVMETPTPVSALLHAGLLNAGPFLIIRLSFLITNSSIAPLILILVGGFTALFASVVFLTQPSIKIALGYSSVAHMGFMFLVCGLGVFPAAMLHLVAHSFYKAHAFLSSGSVVEVLRTSRIQSPARHGSFWRIITSILISLAIYLGLSFAWGIDPSNDFALMATGAIIVMGLSQILAPTIDSGGSLNAIVKSIVLAFVVGLAFFSLESGTHHLLLSQLPGQTVTSPQTQILSIFVLAGFSFVVLLQLVAPALKRSGLGYILFVHVKNGLYSNALFDRVVGALYRQTPKYHQKETQSAIEKNSPIAEPYTLYSKSTSF